MAEKSFPQSTICKFKVKMLPFKGPNGEEVNPSDY
jgi:hypothetical protein